MGFIGFSFDLAAISFKAQFISCHLGWVRGVTFKNCHFVKLTTLMSAAIFTVYENESRLQALSSRERKVELHWDICARQYQLWEGTVHCPHPCNWQLVWLPHETVPVTLHRFTMCSHNVQHNTRLSPDYKNTNTKYKYINPNTHCRSTQCSTQHDAFLLLLHHELTLTTLTVTRLPSSAICIVCTKYHHSIFVGHTCGDILVLQHLNQVS